MTSHTRSTRRIGGVRLALAMALALPALFALAAPAHADLMLFPTRIEIDGNMRAAQVELVNRDTTPASYKVAIINRRMTDTGEVVEVVSPTPEEQFVDGMVLFTPRLITLEPGGSQIVRIMVRKPANLPQGEYRTHLQFDRLPDLEDAANIEKLPEAMNTGAASIRLTALIGASIPVIIRQGRTQATLALRGLTLEPGGGSAPAALTFEMDRTGNRSTYGDLIATYEPRGGQPVEVGNVGGVAVYVPNAVRRARLPLTLPDGVALKGGSIVLRYVARPDAGGGVLAESRIPVP